ncbi:N-acetylmuramoyl-L-alanine amidase [Niabella insulamsoli]|uniref:N-acetylmuramoyl-L-alanine amidase n=1 Tax=Niabella insulamsoli TaxID=3144874 RepID=UPI0031FE10BD
MFIKKTFPALALLMLCACGDTMPKKTNVLNRNPSSNNTAKKQPQTNSQPNQTVFKRPEQITRRQEEKPEPEVARPERPKEVYTPPKTATNSGQLTYRSAEYYRHITDSIQYYAKPSYEKTIDEIINQISRNPAQKKNPAVNSQWYASVNFNVRKPNFVVLHHTAQNSAEQTLFTFSISRTQTSAHYVVGRDGIVYQMLNDYVRAWHAGNSKWGNVTDMNSCSLGIEIDNNGSEPFSDAQITALIKLLDYLKDEYGIPQANFIAHSDVAPSRKSDPSKHFPWKRLADAGFGYWYDAYNLQTPPADFNALLALRVMGYDINNQAAAIRAFKLHYVQNDVSGSLTDYDKKILYSVYRKF